MPILHHTEASEHRFSGGTFRTYLAPSRGSRQLCAWEVSVPPNVVGRAHRPTQEQVMLVLDGDPVVTLEGELRQLKAGDVILAPSDGEIRVDGG